MDTQVKTCASGEAVASSSPLLISRRAYRDTTGHAPQHKPSPKVKKNDRQKVKVIEKEQRQEMRTTNRPRSYEQGDGCCAEKTRGLVVEQGRNGVVQAVKESNQRKVGYRVLGQSNNVSRCLEPLRETAHHTDERHVKISKNLVVERGDGAKRAVGKSTPPWAQCETQGMLSNDDTCCWSSGTRCLDDKRHIEVPRLNASPVGRGGMGDLPTLKEKHFRTENTGVHQYDARHNEKSNTSPIRGGETDMTDQHRVKAVGTKQIPVSYQTPGEPMNLVTGRDDANVEDAFRGKQPRKPPDYAWSVSERNKTIRNDHRLGLSNDTSIGLKLSNSRRGRYREETTVIEKRALCCQGKGTMFGNPSYGDELDATASSTRPDKQQSMLFYE